MILKPVNPVSIYYNIVKDSNLIFISKIRFFKVLSFGVKFWFLF
jgi:hypothetical protein